MVSFNLVLIGISILFVVFLLLRRVFAVNVCALCAAVATTWALLLLLMLLPASLSIDPLLVGILMGGSVVGGMYVLEEKLPDTYVIFKLPLYLTLVTASYFVLRGAVVYTAIILLGLLWVVFLAFHINRNTKGFKALGMALIECCKNW